MLSTLPAPVVDDATRREFLAMLASAGLLTGCATPTTAAPAPAATATWDGGPFGPVEIPREPQRVVACNGVDTDFALALGLPLVGAPGALAMADTPFAAYHADRLDGVTPTLTGGEPNVEQVASLRPDVILDSWDFERPRYDDWSAIAPTVNFAPALYPDMFARTDWPGALRALGTAFGREQAAEDAIAVYRSAVGAARGRLAVRPGATFAGIVALGAEGISVVDAEQQISKVALDLGLTPHPLVAADYTSRASLSTEEIGRLAEAEVLFVGVGPATGSLERDRSTLDPITASPLWQRLPAVTAGRVVEYPSELYYASPLTAPGLVTVLADALAGSGS